MNYRNAKRIEGDRIDCEIEHERWGWIPYTLDPADEDDHINNDELLEAMALNDDVADYVAPTQTEVDAVQDAEHEAQATKAMEDTAVKVMFDQLNELRAELGKPILSGSEVKSEIKNKLKAKN